MTDEHATSVTSVQGDAEREVRRKLAEWDKRWPDDPPFFSPNTVGVLLEELDELRARLGLRPEDDPHGQEAGTE